MNLSSGRQFSGWPACIIMKTHSLIADTRKIYNMPCCCEIYNFLLGLLHSWFDIQQGGFIQSNSREPDIILHPSTCPSFHISSLTSIHPSMETESTICCKLTYFTMAPLPQKDIVLLIFHHYSGLITPPDRGTMWD